MGKIDLPVTAITSIIYTPAVHTINTIITTIATTAFEKHATAKQGDLVASPASFSRSQAIWQIPTECQGANREQGLIF
jgi:hypothetical protein